MGLSLISGIALARGFQLKDNEIVYQNYSFLKEVDGRSLISFIYYEYKIVIWSFIGLILLLGLAIFILLLNIIKRKDVEERLRDSKERLRLAMWGTNQGIWDWNLKTDEIYFNYQWADMLGYKPQNLSGKFSDLQHLFYPGDMKQMREEMESHLIGEKSIYEVECRVLTRSGKWKWILSRGKIISRNREGEALRIIGTHQDISQRKEAEKKIKYVNSHDYLTELYNRHGYQEKLDQLDKDGKLPLSVIIGDVNGLKVVNDVFGHDRGDQLLQEIATILKSVTRKKDIVARWGGDEFGVILPTTTSKQVQKVIDRINEECQTSSFEPINPDIALGQATKEKSAEDLEEIINQAENRMYQNKLSCKKNRECRMLGSLEDNMLAQANELGVDLEESKQLALKLGRELDLSIDRLEKLSLLARFKDVGKLAIEEEILIRDDKCLTAKEQLKLQEHVEIGYRLAKNFQELTPIANCILFHHEQWNGEGYPQGLKEKNIPLLSRVIAVVDSYQSLAKQVGLEVAREELKRLSADKLDPKLVDIFIKQVIKCEK